MVNCLTDDFLAQNGDLLDSFWQLAGHDYIDHQRSLGHNIAFDPKKHVLIRALI